MGCFRDTGRRAIATLEGKHPRLLYGAYRRRGDAIVRCAAAAMKHGFRTFAVQHGGWCASSKNGHRTYAKYGKSNACRGGKGGAWANDVYMFKRMYPSTEEVQPFVSIPWLVVNSCLGNRF